MQPCVASAGSALILLGSMRVLLLLVLVAASASGFCITRTGYYVASKALAVGIGLVQSNAACKFTNVTGISLNGDCPPQCAVLIRATWGDCYCEQPTFVPDAGDAPFDAMTAQQLFQFIAGSYNSSYGVQAHCRDWMNTPSSVAMWACNGTNVHIV